jgi:photosystem II stability/assembly factor-like uncharacterized protein
LSIGETMSTSRRQQTRKGAADAGRKANIRQAPTKRSQRQRMIGLGVLLLVAVGLGGAWWLLPLGDDEQAKTDGSGPIASLDAPDVHSLLIDPSDPQRVLFGSHLGTMESRDGGFTWEVGSLRGADAMMMSVSQNDAAALYVAGHDVFLMSRDRGETWARVEHNLPGTDLHAFAQDPVNPQRLYAYVAGDRIYASTDGGATWAALPSQPSNQPLALASNGTTLFAATPTGIETSSTTGDDFEWTQLASQPNAGAMSLAISATNPELIYAGTPSGVAKSDDLGRTWESLGPHNVPALALAVAPSDPDRVLFVTPLGDVYRSDDGGDTWLAPT